MAGDRLLGAGRRDLVRRLVRKAPLVNRRGQDFERQFQHFALRAMGWSFMVASVIAAFRFGVNPPTHVFAAIGLYAAVCKLDR